MKMRRDIGVHSVCIALFLLASCTRDPAPAPVTSPKVSAVPQPPAEDSAGHERRQLAQELQQRRADLVKTRNALMQKKDYVGASDVMLPYLETEDDEVKRLYAESEAALLKSLGSWRYEDEEDRMAGGKVRTAVTASTNEVNFGFPYQGSQRARLLLRNHPRYGRDVMLLLDKAQFLCAIGGCKVAVKFGSEKPQMFTAGPPNDHSSNVLFIRGHDRFVAEAKRVEKLLLEAQFYQEGNHVFEFDVAGLKWP